MILNEPVVTGILMYRIAGEQACDHCHRTGVTLSPFHFIIWFHTITRATDAGNDRFDRTLRRRHRGCQEGVLLKDG